MSQREESASKSAGKGKSGKKTGKKAGKPGKAVPKKQLKRRSGQHSTDPSTPRSKLQDKLREAENREYRSSRTDKVVGAAAAPTKLDEFFDSVSQHKAWAIPLIVVAAVGAGAYAGVGTALLVLAGAFMLFVISSFWASVQSLTGEADLNLDEALSLAAPSAELEQKRATLRALKDLEFEHSIGKITDADYKDLSARYRAEAKRLLQQLSGVEGKSRKRAEKLLELKLLEADPDVKIALPSEVEDSLANLSEDKRERVENLLKSSAFNAARAKAQGLLDAEDEDEAAASDEADSAAAAAPAEDAEGEPGSDQDEDEDEHNAVESQEEDSDEDEDSDDQDEDSDEGFVDDPVTSKQGVTGPSRLCKACKTRNVLANTHCAECDAPLAGPEELLCSACPAVYSDSEDACPVCGVAAPEDQD
ncbi:MAG: zinc ribbon domain-containing protein [Myxococcales bacterium]|nr:zinc ribbon domain-containing protein [Myxococcales bacterium]